MTREEFLKAYPWTINMTRSDLQKMVMFMVMGLLEVSMGIKEEDVDKSKLAGLMTNVKSQFDLMA